MQRLYLPVVLPSSLVLLALASFPCTCAAFGCTKEREGPGMFPRMRDVEGRKVVERTYVGDLGLRTGRRASYQVTYHTYLASGGRLSYTPSVERVVGLKTLLFRSENLGHLSIT